MVGEGVVVVFSVVPRLVVIFGAVLVVDWRSDSGGKE